MTGADGRLLRRVVRARDGVLDPSCWPLTVPAVRQVWEHGLELGDGVTFLVGENGSGKSTLVEAVAEAAGLGVEGGSRHARHRTRATESPLAEHLALVTAPGGLGHGWFLRAETMHGLYTYLEEVGGRDYHLMSHGESFLQVVEDNAGWGLFVLDEPESALSFRSSLALLVVLQDLVARGSQVLCATHSPLLLALPGATLLELGEHGVRESTYDELDLVRDWRGFLEAPERYLRHLLP